MQISKFLCKTSGKTLLKFMEIIKYSVKLVKIKVFSCTIVRFQLKIIGISHISHISHTTYISYCFSTSSAYLIPMLTSEQIIAAIQTTVRKSCIEC